MSNAVFLLCLIMTIIFMSIPLLMLIMAAVKRQKSIIMAGLIWLGANVLLIVLIWIIYAIKFAHL